MVGTLIRIPHDEPNACNVVGSKVMQYQKISNTMIFLFIEWGEKNKKWLEKREKRKEEQKKREKREKKALAVTSKVSKVITPRKKTITSSKEAK